MPLQSEQEFTAKRQKKVLANYSNMKIKFPSICYDLYYNSQTPKCTCTDDQVKKIVCLLVKLYF